MNHEKQLSAMLVPFYLGEQRDSEDRTIQEIWTWDFEELECTHNYIQWLFPLPERSAFNSNAPIVNKEVIQAFKKNPRLRENLLRSLTVILKFYGLERHESNDGKIVISQSKDYPNRKREWVHIFNHNYLRITRILKCLMTFGLENEAQAFYECLRQIYREDSDRIGSETFQHWTIAVKSNMAM
ncbi:MAG: opioid growth factor receptor-related protein [Nostoc sp. DedVER02]|uniref:opioid growth factor receptor-related protein n=1 Tax=unclassified Nostoc TaxID=2593658 RepID=UPI002AD57D37|nr:MULTISPECIES: opioid growth factor receptor-related protein [unclassified Nostoc]MDZ7988716.1 opioid growth factor receptor-related protein [Nostoc sp. DedVER02]MDZ8113215.1 opioid growth factor receptor-related protein [Nostoc sp. DedVER01b]